MAAVTDEAIEYAYPEIDFGTADVPDLEELMARLQAQGKRVVRIRYIGQPAWLILRHKELYDAFMDSAHYPCSGRTCVTARPSWVRASSVSTATSTG